MNAAEQRDRIRAERVAQGFAPTISDPEALAVLAALLVRREGA